MVYITDTQFKTKDAQWCFHIHSISISKVDELKFDICSPQTCCHLYKNWHLVGGGFTEMLVVVLCQMQIDILRRKYET